MSEALAQAPTRKRNRPNHLLIGKLESERDQLLEDLTAERSRNEVQESGLSAEIDAYRIELASARARMLAYCATSFVAGSVVTGAAMVATVVLG